MDKQTMRYKLTKERILQAEQSVVLGRCHVAEPAVVLMLDAVRKVCVAVLSER